MSGSLYCASDKALEWVAQRGCGVFPLGDLRNHLEVVVGNLL